MRITSFALFAAFTIPLSGQIQEDPREKVQEILDQVAKDMKQIDSWLQESSRSKDAGAAMKKNIARLDKLLESVGESQKQVVKGIDELLKEAEKMKSDGQGDGT
jgi:DnaJ-domain-containing protein 1